MPRAGRSGAAGSSSDSAGGAGTDAGTASPTSSPQNATRLYGVTIEEVSSIDDIVESLQMLARKPTVRVVFQNGEPATRYTRSVQRIHAVGGVMGEVLDSFAVKNISVDEYGARVSEFLDALGDDVDIWEIGNEVNGDWLGTNDDVHDKITNAYQLVHSRGKTTALTLYYNQGCYLSADHEMFHWAERYVDPELQSGLDYVLVSYYEDDCKGLQPDWNDVFKRLATMFPNSKIGFGECGTTDDAKKAEFIERYYQLQIDLPQYVGGYFWWYYYQDMLPYTSKLWSVLNQALLAGP
jgi:hypothetical protein